MALDQGRPAEVDDLLAPIAHTRGIPGREVAALHAAAERPEAGAGQRACLHAAGARIDHGLLAWAAPADRPSLIARLGPVAGHPPA